MIACLLLTFLLAPLPSTAVLASGKPSRSECIAGYRIEWPDLARDRHGIVNSIADDGFRRSVPDSGLIAAIAFNENHTALYFQLVRECQRKWEVSQAFLDAWKGAKEDVPLFSGISGVIVPSPSTIDVQGEYWRD